MYSWTRNHLAMAKFLATIMALTQVGRDKTVPALTVLFLFATVNPCAMACYELEVTVAVLIIGSDRKYVHWQTRMSESVHRLHRD